jgi:hypothetical protein
LLKIKNAIREDNPENVLEVYVKVAVIIENEE